MDSSRQEENAGIAQNSAKGLFVYQDADETQISSDEKQALVSIRAEYPGTRIVSLAGVRPSPDGPRAGDSRNSAASEWSSAFEVLFKKKVLFVSAPVSLSGANPQSQRNVIVVNVNSVQPLFE